MTITQLTTFLKIREKGSFSSAADNLGYAQSTVTMQIKQLEDELGVELFERLGKQVSLTSAGERLLIYAERMLQLEREILTDVPQSEEPAGVLKLGISESLCYNRLPGILLKYTNVYPKIDLRLSFITHESFPEMLKNGSLDIVYTLNPLIEKDDLTLLYKKEESLGFYASPSHSLARKKKVAEADLENMPLLLTSSTCNFHSMLISDMKESHIAPRITLETSSKEILKQFAMNSLGITFIPDMAAEQEVKNKKLVRLNWKGKDFPVYSQVLIHKDKHIGKTIQGLVDIISGDNGGAHEGIN